jgi:hypothetical protein
MHACPSGAVTMSSRHSRSTSRAAILLVALVVGGLIASPALRQDGPAPAFAAAQAGATVHFRTAPFDFGHERAAPAEFVLAVRPPLA